MQRDELYSPERFIADPKIVKEFLEFFEVNSVNHLPQWREWSIKDRASLAIDKYHEFTKDHKDAQWLKARGLLL